MNILKNQSPPPRCTQPLELEALERRLLLSTVLNGIEADGDEYQIKLTGSGTVVDGSLENLITSGTNLNSR